MTADLPRTISAVVPRLRSGELTPLDLVEECFARVDRYEGRVHAWVYLDRDRAMADAKRLTEELQRGQDRGPLHGIPIGIKDIIDVFDMPTGCGSKLWANSIARKDATCVARLRQAGAIILGKTVTTPFAFLDPPPTRNPWNLDRTPGGSSSGSAAAVACGMCLAALGTQTGGSVTRPASFCGVFSLKPTHGRISLEGVLPLAPSLDHVGVIANCVRDLTLIYRVVAGQSDSWQNSNSRTLHDPLMIGVNWRYRPVFPRRESADYVSFQVTNDFFPDRTEIEMSMAFQNVLGKLSPGDDPERLRDLILPPSFSEIPPAHFTLMASEAAATHAERFARHPEDYPHKIREFIQAGSSISGPEYSKAWVQQNVAKAEFQSLELTSPLLVPATIGPAPTIESTGNPIFNSPWSFLGLPTVSLPFAHTEDGLPLCVQLVGANSDEDLLLRSAEKLESLVGYTSRSVPLE